MPDPRAACRDLHDLSQFWRAMPGELGYHACILSFESEP